MILERPVIRTAEQWCDYYGATVEDGIATLYKAVDDEYRSGFNCPSGRIAYTPGTQPEAPDWDGGERECGGGLHFSPHPSLATRFMPHPSRYVACPVALADIVVHEHASQRDKVKAPRVCAPVYEVDRRGRRVEGEAAA